MIAELDHEGLDFTRVVNLVPGPGERPVLFRHRDNAVVADKASFKWLTEPGSGTWRLYRVALRGAVRNKDGRIRKGVAGRVSLEWEADWGGSVDMTKLPQWLRVLTLWCQPFGSTNVAEMPREIPAQDDEEFEELNAL